MFILCNKVCFFGGSSRLSLCDEMSPLGLTVNEDSPSSNTLQTNTISKGYEMYNNY